MNRVALVAPAWSAVPRLRALPIEFSAGDKPEPPFSSITTITRPTSCGGRGGERRGRFDQRVPRAGGRRRGALSYQPGGDVRPRAADEFLAAYRDAADGFTYDPYWDLDSLLDMCLAGPSYYPPWQEFGLAPFLGRCCGSGQTPTWSR